MWKDVGRPHILYVNAGLNCSMVHLINWHPSAGTVWSFIIVTYNIGYNAICFEMPPPFLLLLHVRYWSELCNDADIFGVLYSQK